VSTAIDNTERAGRLSGKENLYYSRAKLVEQVSTKKKKKQKRQKVDQAV